MTTLVLDTNIYDRIDADPRLAAVITHLSSIGALRILSTHVQEGELAAIPDEEKRARIAQIPREIVPTAGAVFGTSRYGASTYGDGSDSGIAVDQVRTPSGGRTEDALIATTASRDADYLVTEDQSFANRVRKLQSRCAVIGFSEFRDLVISLDSPRRTASESG
ncbi:MAG: hypothetical protein QN141_09810 [Armatimonadota bacterium]|nr:hypothetical protein [Armatimonadota bacterium]